MAAEQDDDLLDNWEDIVENPVNSPYLSLSAWGEEMDVLGGGQGSGRG